MSSKWSALALVLALVAAACSPEPAKKTPAPAKPSSTDAGLQPFASESALRGYFKLLPPVVVPSSLGSAQPSIVMEAPPPQLKSASGVSAGLFARAVNSITNNQVSGVDEGDIVKARGDTLVILRRGRLFTVSVADDAMRPIDSIDAYPPGVDASEDWYDEMLVGADRIIVIGYSYSRGGTQINRFRIDRAGYLAYEDAYQLRSNDYYSSRNYASRLIGNQLIFYTPQYVNQGFVDPEDVMPAVRRWSSQGVKGKFERIGTAQDVYMPPNAMVKHVEAMHSVTFCDITTEVLNCKAKSVLGPAGRVFFVSHEAVYVWTTPFWPGDDAYKNPTAFVIRLPLDGGVPSAVGARGAPTDQFSFREARGALDVLIRSESVGDAMWAPEASQGRIALVHISRDSFGDGSKELPFKAYRGLPLPEEVRYFGFQNRFVGDFVLYGQGNGWYRPQNGDSAVFVAPVVQGTAVKLKLPHGVDRIETIGRDAVIVGSDNGNLTFSTIVLKPGTEPTLGDRYVLAGASQSETRSHGFFFQAGHNPQGGSFDGAYGVLGLPVSRPSGPAYHQLFEESAAVIFVRRINGKFTLLGELPSHPAAAENDHCVASCVDWYGNARPIFLGDRTFALMGYEIVEGVLDEKDMRETARMNFAPGKRK